MTLLKIGSRTCVSVIVPIYNRFDLAYRAIQSIQAQTYRPLEIVAVDDCSHEPFCMSSTSGPADVEQRVLRLDRNVGPGGAREAGRQVATGDFLAYLDSDDYYAPEFVARMVAALQANPNAGMAYSSARWVEAGRLSTIRRRSAESYTRILPTILLGGRPWPTCSCLWRKAAADRIGPWLSLRNWEDYEYECRAGAMDIAIVHVAEELCFLQRDAPGRASDGHRRTSVAHQEKALSAMASSIRTSRYADEPIVRRAMTRLLFNNSLEACKLCMAGTAIRSVRSGWRWSDQRFLLAGPSLLASGLISARAWAASMRLIRRIRHVAVHPGTFDKVVNPY